jgi:hypothetical protein
MILNLGLSTADLNNLTMGMVIDLALFKSGESNAEREATQDDFDNF